MPDAHALISASGFKAMRLCPGKLAMEQGKPDRPSAYAAWGTVAHHTAELCLRTGAKPSASRGETHKADGFDIKVDAEMVDCVQAYLDHVHGFMEEGDTLLVEQKAAYARYLSLDEDLAWGTGDAVILGSDTITVIDLKTGQGVAVDPEMNDQMMLYGLGALAAFGDLGDYTKVRLVVSQPRSNPQPKVWEVSVDELEAWGYGPARSAAASAINALELFKSHDGNPPQRWIETFLRPSEDACRFCRAKAICPALATEVEQGVCQGGAFEDLTSVPDLKPTAEARLALYMSKVGLVEDWCKAVRAEVEARLFDGTPVPGFKLVQGKKGARQWADEQQAEELLRKFKLKVEEAYSMKLISPTQAEKLLKAGTLGPRQWTKLQALITQSEGSPSVAPEGDKRPALTVDKADAFDNLDINDIA